MSIVRWAAERNDPDSPGVVEHVGEVPTGRGVTVTKPTGRPMGSEAEPFATVRAPVELKTGPARSRLPGSGAEAVSDRPPVDLRAREGLLVAGRARTVHADEFRSIQAQLMAGVHRGGSAAGAAVILVTSALPGEGKSAVALAIALSIASHSESTVLLVDAHLDRRGLSVQLGIEGRKGLGDVLADPSLRIADVICSTDVRRVLVLPAGTPHESSMSRLAEDATGALLESLGAATGRVVVVDCPAVLESDAVRSLAACAGQVVLVVKASATPRAAVAEALRSLGDHPGVSMVLNKVARPRGSGAWHGGTR